MCRQAYRGFREFDWDPAALLVVEQVIEEPVGQIIPQEHISERNAGQIDDVSVQEISVVVVVPQNTETNMEAMQPVQQERSHQRTVETVVLPVPRVFFPVQQVVEDLADIHERNVERTIDVPVSQMLQESLACSHPWGRLR